MAAFIVPRRSTIISWEGTLDSLVPEDHLARFIWQVLLSIDFGLLEAEYRAVNGGPGRPPYHPRVLAALWIYGMTQGLETAMGVAQACRLRDDFRWLAGGLCPSDQTLLNLLDKGEELLSIWGQVLEAMHLAGYIDLSMVAEDGTKLRANASQRSFRTAEEIEAIIDKLKSNIATKKLANPDPSLSSKVETEIYHLELQLQRAEHAAEELRERAERRDKSTSQGTQSQQAKQAKFDGKSNSSAADEKFRHSDFRHNPEHDEMICPAGEKLRLVGVYDRPSGKSRYRLYGRAKCDDCTLKHKCTTSRRGRRLKVAVARPSTSTNASSAPDNVAQTPTNEGCVGNEASFQSSGKRKRGPQASLTDPESVMMLATADKRWEPSYNADIVVTRQGVIVSQRLTKRPSDFHNFAPALKAVVSTLGTPDSWVGDGHYGTHENLLLADEADVVLYAPPASRKNVAKTTETTDNTQRCNKSKPRLFSRRDFQHVAERDVLLCPGGEELKLIGIWPKNHGHGLYKVYSRTSCIKCPLKDKCTTAKARRVKVPVADAADCKFSNKAIPAQKLDRLCHELDERMAEHGDSVLQFRRQTVEPANAHLKQHGLGRFHVRGLQRCAVVLTLACIAHNLMKWKMRYTTELMNLAA